MYTSGLIASIVGVFLLAMLYEAMRSLRIVLYHNRDSILTKAKCFLDVQYKKLYSSKSVEMTSQDINSTPTSMPTRYKIICAHVHSILLCTCTCT